MYYTEDEARNLVIEVGKRLKELGLVPRTWGNISARISEDKFVVTPSGIPYDKITPDKTVVVDVNTLKYDKSDVQPSDEMGIHADAYKLRKNVNFVIHTHQFNASVFCATGVGIYDIPQQFKSVVGDCIPMGEYGLPSTKKLCRGVKSAIEQYPDSKAAFMKHHGIVCMGKDDKEAINIALAVEEICRITFENKYKELTDKSEFNKNDMINFYLSLENQQMKLPLEVEDLGESVRMGEDFKLIQKNGQGITVNIADCLKSEDFKPEVAKIHAAIYATQEVKCISHLTNEYIMACSMVGKKMIPYLDDCSQIVGVTIDCDDWNKESSSESAKTISNRLHGKNAVLLKGYGAIAIANSKFDLEAVNLVLSKECQSAIGVKLFEQGKPLPYSDRYIMRFMYLYWYTQKIKKLK